MNLFSTRVVDDEYLRMVRSHSILTKGSLAPAEAITEIALNQSDPRIGYILGAFKKADGTFLFNASNELQRSLVIRDLMFNSVFSGNITRISSAFTASVFLYSIPVEDDIKFLSVGKNLEKEAKEELDRLAERIGEESTLGQALGLTESSQRFFFAFDINPSSIDVHSFGENPFIAPNPEVYKILPSSPEALNLCYLYLSAKLGSSSFEEKIEKVFPISGTIGEVVDTIAKEININTLLLNNLTSLPELNILASPTAVRKIPQSFIREKEELFTIDNDPNPNALVFGTVTIPFYAISFEGRKYQDYIYTELVSMNFARILKEDLIPNSTYIGPYISDSYNLNDIVTFQNKDYVSLVDNNTSAPPSFQWREITSFDLITPFNESSNKEIPGLLFGMDAIYSTLLNTGPISSFISIKKNGVNFDGIPDEPPFNKAIEVFTSSKSKSKISPRLRKAYDEIDFYNSKEKERGPYYPYRWP